MRTFLVVLAILLGIAAASLGVLATLPQPDLPDGFRLILPIAAAWGGWAAITVVALSILFALMAKLWRRVAPVFGETVTARLLSFGVISLIFSETVRSVIYPFARFVLQLSLRIPTDLAASSPRSIAAANRDAASASADTFGSLLAQPFYAFGQGLLSINYAWLFVALAAWAVVGQIVSSALRATPGAAADNPWSQLVARLRSAGPAAWQNVLLFAVIAMGGLLSVSALITLPLLSQANLSTEQLQRIDADFDSIVKANDTTALSATDLALPETLTKSLDDLGARIATERMRQTARATPPVQAAPPGPEAQGQQPAGDGDLSPAYAPRRATKEQALAQLQTLDDDRAGVVRDARSTWKDLQPSLQQALVSAKTSAVLAVKRQNYAPGGAGSEYVARVNSWLNDTVAAAESSANYCRTGLIRTIETFVDNAKISLESLENDFPPLVLQLNRARPYDCTATFPYRDQPEEAGLTLGAFGFSAWLIELNSLPLTLIAGMLGFGLVGAAVSSVIRERKDRDASKPLVSDITGILVRGVSATIVVYLAVKGGLVIFTAGSAGEPDPHVLLLTCLIASVFSEDVWAAARERFAGALKGNRPDASTASGPDGSGTPGSPADSGNTPGPAGTSG